MRVVYASELEFIPASHEDPEDPGVLKKVLATKEHLQVGKIQMLNWSWLRAGKSFEKHYHEDMQEVFIIAHGNVTMAVETRGEIHELSLGPGDAVLVDPREVHWMTNPTESDVFYLVFGVSDETGGKTVRV